MRASVSDQKLKPLHTLVLSVVLYACESWTTTEDSYKDHIANEQARRKKRQVIWWSL